jgi:Fic family protein
MEIAVYKNVTALEPLLPPTSPLEELAVEVIRESAALSARIHPITRAAIAVLLRTINSYYSNLIEGHDTRPAAIERAMREDFSEIPELRARQLESIAHIEVERLMEERLSAEPGLDICSDEFLRWLHREFYARMPEEYCFARRRGTDERVPVIGGALRDEPVIVGRHLGPDHVALSRFLSRFNERYRPDRLSPVERVIAAAASHHRLLWIHPFLDGNGRITRLFTEAFLRRARIESHGLWSISRGLARNRERYIELLANADQQRRDDYDGRGNLSEAALTAFCRFFLETALDQILYMGSLLDLDELDRRIAGYVELRHRGLTATRAPLRLEAAPLLRDVALRGEVARGEVARITGLPERTVRRLTSQLIDEGLLASETPKGPLRLGLPTAVASYYFPGLYPEETTVGAWA